MKLIDKDDNFINNFLVSLDNSDFGINITNTLVYGYGYKTNKYISDITELGNYSKYLGISDCIVMVYDKIISKSELEVLRNIRRETGAHIIVFANINTISENIKEEFFESIGRNNEK